MKEFYDYKSDYPEGNGWRYWYEGLMHDIPKVNFCGEIISSPDYVFPRGKYEGKTLQGIVGRCWQGIIKYIDYGLIFITKECFDKLVCNTEKLRAIKVANDSKLLFCRVDFSIDEIYTKPFACSYQGIKFIDVVINDPQYLIGIIKRGLDPYYGDNQRYYANDRSETLMHSLDPNMLWGPNSTIKWLERMADELQQQGVNNDLTSFLIDTKNEIEEEIRAAEEEQWQRDMEKYWEEETRAIYNEQNDAYWDDRYNNQNDYDDYDERDYDRYRW